MNKRLSISASIILMLPILACAQWTTSGTNISSTNTGNVGIGTVNPQSRLHVHSELSGFSAISIGSPNSLGNIYVPLGASPGGYNIDFYTWRDMEPNQIGARIGAERINTYQPNAALVQAMDLSFSTSSGIAQSELAERMRISNNGNVGIGTAKPNAKLAVNGNIRAHEIKVETANWPDYVFAKDYQLPSLQKTEQHIKEKGHLPDIPSAEEVKANGVDLGEMNAKLLKKVEELTLYLIDQKKEIQLQSEELKSQQQKLKQFENQIELLNNKKDEN
ncbi:hypothetical protein [Pedobacter sp. B4-66]|uniref:hypothetical protein n=1 Tax=Pedobacter sp. B4-66 TaxID=2817280 RepID=UPI001BDA8EA9|nr:hypothetical protein [Pedobacter sp. B4-66]